MEIRQKIIDEARTWLGTPFIHQAAVKGAGIGCGTFLIEVYGALGFKVPDITKLGHFPHDWQFHTADERYLSILKDFTFPTEEPSPGDIALFKLGRVYSHSAIIVEWPQVIHVMWRRSVEYCDASKMPLARRPVKFLSVI